MTHTYIHSIGNCARQIPYLRMYASFLKLVIYCNNAVKQKKVFVQLTSRFPLTQITK